MTARLLSSVRVTYAPSSAKASGISKQKFSLIRSLKEPETVKAPSISTYTPYPSPWETFPVIVPPFMVKLPLPT